MEELQRAIKNITQQSEKFPKEELELIGANRDAAVPYLRDAVEKALREKDDLEGGYHLHFYAIFLLAQFQDREFFPKLMELASLPEDTVDFLIGDVLTDGLADILYSTYNGDLVLLRQTILDGRVSDFARAAMLNVMAQLYVEQKLDRQEWQAFLREIVNGRKSIGDYIYTETADVICRCHFTEMVPELRHLYLDGRVDERVLGGYDEWIDCMFTYKEKDGRFCRTSVDAIKQLRKWAMYEKPSGDEAVDDDADDREDDKLDRMFENILGQFGGGSGAAGQRVSVKVGRNDPCPCGSGKKYKQCCLKKNQITADGAESAQEREKWLENYPPVSVEHEEGRAYLEDFYDSESIELDKLLYLALKRRDIPSWQRDSDQGIAARRQRRYLTDAYHKFKEIVGKEGIQNLSEYDDKHSIHYLSAEWLGKLSGLLKEDDRDGILADVRATLKKMGK